MLRYMYKENEDDFTEHELERAMLCDYLDIDFIPRSYPNERIEGHTLEEEIMIVDESVELIFDDGQVPKDYPTFVEYSTKELDFELEKLLEENRKWVKKNDTYVTDSEIEFEKFLEENRKWLQENDTYVTDSELPPAPEERELLISGAGAPPIPSKK